MKIKDILRLIKLLLVISDQVTEVIASTSIPKAEQAQVKEEINAATTKLQLAKLAVEVDPE